MRVLGGMALAAFGLMVLFALVIGFSKTLDPTATEAEVIQQRPFADVIGREYRVISAVSAFAWNDFPNKDRILSVALTPPGTRNRFVSWVRPLKIGQAVRPISGLASRVLYWASPLEL